MDLLNIKDQNFMKELIAKYKEMCEKSHQLESFNREENSLKRKSDKMTPCLSQGHLSAFDP